VYDAKIKALDYLSLPAAGANLGIVLANGTKISETAPLDGTVYLSKIPLGSVTVTASDLGASATASGDASKGDTIVVRLPLGYVALGTFIGAFAILVVALTKARARTTYLRH